MKISEIILGGTKKRLHRDPRKRRHVRDDNLYDVNLSDLSETELDEVIRKVGDQYRLYSKKGKNLGTYDSKAGAEKREKQVNYFKHMSEGYNPYPVKTLNGLYHVGTMDSSKKRDGYEGAGISVSTHPDAWRKIARGHVTGDTHSATKEGNKFLDAHSLSDVHKEQIKQWAIKNDYLAQQETVTVCYYDDEMENDICSTFNSMADAEAEYDDELEFMDVTVEKGGIVPTDKLKKETRQNRIESTGVLDFVLPIFAEQQGLDGVWWQDTLDVQRYSAPRGVIVPSKIKSWKFAVKKNESVNEETGEKMFTYFQKIHSHEPDNNSDMKKFILSHEWELRDFTPDMFPSEEEFFDYDDPFDRVIDIDYYHRVDLSQPIIVGPQYSDGKYSVIDGNHRAARAQQLGKTIKGYFPVKATTEGVAREPDPTGYSHTRLTAPANTIVINTPGELDWYKMGEYIANLGNEDPHEFGQSESDMVVTLANREQVEKLKSLLDRLGAEYKEIGGSHEHPEVHTENKRGR